MKRYLITLVLISISHIVWSQDKAMISAVIDSTNTPIVQELEEVTVVGEKEGMSLFDTPISASKMTSREIKVASINNIKDLSLTIPNMFMPDYGTKLTSPVYIRGIGSRINSPSVGLYVDGIPYFEKSAFDFDFSDISTIEVLRGPQGTMYGRNTMGGIINVTTRSPLVFNGTSASLSLGNVGQIQASVSDYRSVSEHFGYGILGFYKHNEGFFYNNTLEDYADRLNSYGGRVKLSYKKDRHKLDVVFGLEYSDQSGYPYMKYDVETKTATEVDYNRASFYRRLLNSTGLSYSYTTDQITLTSRTSYQFSRDHQGIDQDFSPSDDYYINQQERQNVITEEIEIRQTHKKRISWIAGVYGFYQQLDKNVKMDTFKSLSATDKYYDTPRYGFAIYGQGTLDKLFIDNLSLTIGLRYDIEKAQMSYLFNSISTTQTIEMDRFTNKLTHQQVTPKFALQYQIQKYGHIYASVTKGYKAGGFNTSFIEEEQKSFLPEFSWNYELGTKFSLVDDRLEGSAALFYIDWKDQQVNQPLATGKGVYIKNAAKSLSKGLELSLGYHPIDRFTIGASYGYTNAIFIDYVAGEGRDYSGNKLPQVPENTASLSMDYVILVKNNKFVDNVTLAAQYSGVGSLYWNDKNTMKQDYYSLLNARVTLTKSIFALSFWGKNLTNSKYYAYYFEALGSSFVQKSRPITFGIDLSVLF